VNAILAIDIVLMLWFVSLEWYRLSSVTMACVIFAYLRESSNLSDFTIAMVSTVGFFFLAIVLPRLKKLNTPS
jgi:hypothetical protein